MSLLKPAQTFTGKWVCAPTDLFVRIAVISSNGRIAVTLRYYILQANGDLRLSLLPHRAQPHRQAPHHLPGPPCRLRRCHCGHLRPLPHRILTQVQDLPDLRFRRQVLVPEFAALGDLREELAKEHLQPSIILRPSAMAGPPQIQDQPTRLPRAVQAQEENRQR